MLRMMITFLAIVLICTPALASDAANGQWLALAEDADRATGGSADAPQTAAGFMATPPDTPFLRHTVEGVGGGWFVPSAYLVNPGNEGEVFGLPAASLTYIGGFSGHHKNIWSFAISETLFGRIELSYAINRVDLSTLKRTVQRRIANDIVRKDVVMHNLNVRGLLLKENSWGLPLPALTAGVHFKCYSAIGDINHRLVIPMEAIGYHRPYGFEYTLTASKAVHLDPLPLIVATVGLRHSEAAHIGYMGFSDRCSTTVETSVTIFPTDWLYISYEFRRKEYPYNELPVAGILQAEDNWHGLGVGVIVNENLTINAGVLWLGNVADGSGDNALACQVKYAF